MELLFQILILIIIGALIGGITNSLAIKMLFRPYRTVYVGKWRLPFTPGLIPKRREELAVQLGKLVITHLLTPESVQRKLNNPDFKNEINQWAKMKTERLLQSTASVEELVHSFLGMKDLDKKVDRKIVDYMEDQLLQSLQQMNEKQLKEVVPDQWLEKADDCIPWLSEYIAKRGIDFFKGPEGTRTLKTLIDQFLDGRGMFANMIQMFLGNESLVEKVQTEIVKLLQQPMFRDVAEQLLRKEWENVKKKKVSDIESWIDLEMAIKDLKSAAASKLPTQLILQTPLNELADPHSDKILDKWVPQMVEWVGKGVSSQVEEAMRYLKLEDIVREQVETFAVERLEEIVLTISKREFKMITYLGALLGAMIGLVQALLLQFI